MTKAATCVPDGKAGASSPEIVWSEFLDTGFSCIPLHHVPDDVFAQPASPDIAGCVTILEILPLEIPAD
jgi:hypothetical protein